jgi:hypothetical protein
VIFYEEDGNESGNEGGGDKTEAEEELAVEPVTVAEETLADEKVTSSEEIRGVDICMPFALLWEASSQLGQKVNTLATH